MEKVDRNCQHHRKKRQYQCLILHNDNLRNISINIYFVGFPQDFHLISYLDGQSVCPDRKSQRTMGMVNEATTCDIENEQIIFTKRSIAHECLSLALYSTMHPSIHPCILCFKQSFICFSNKVFRVQFTKLKLILREIKPKLLNRYALEKLLI